jgi:anti-sigma factor RsiW
MIPGQDSSQDCPKLEPLLDDYLHGELPRARAEQLASHLEVCGNCRGALDDLRISARLVGSVFEAVGEPAPGFARLVMAGIHTADQRLQAQRAFWRPFEAVAWRLAFSAALALAFLFAYGFRANARSASAPSPVLVPQADAFVQPTSFSPAPSNSDEVLMAIAERHHAQQ